MGKGRWSLIGVVLVNFVGLSGCADLEKVRQLEMANRNIVAEKAALEQELYDERTNIGSLRVRADALEDQLASKNQLVSNLERENDSLESNFSQAQNLLEKMADRPLGAVVAQTGQLPPELDAALAQFAEANPSTVQYDREHGTIKWKSDLLFTLGSDVVKARAGEILGGFTAILRSPAARNFEVIVVGHTDATPISKPATRQMHPTNRHLSVHRAISVAKLLQRQGLASTRIGTMGYGEFRPLVANDSEENRIRNRRVEMYIVPLGVFSAGAMGSDSALSFTGDDAVKSTK